MNEDSETSFAKLVVVHGEEQERMPKLINLFSRRDWFIRDDRHIEESFQILKTVTRVRLVPVVLVNHPVNDGVKLVFHDEWKTDSPVLSSLYGFMLNRWLLCECYRFHFCSFGFVFWLRAGCWLASSPVCLLSSACALCRPTA